MRRLVSLFLLLSISFFVVNGQQTGQWKEYLSTSKARYVAESESRIYCATDGGLFYINQNDNSFEKLTRSNGLSDAGVDIIKYDKENRVLLITYTNSNIDLFFEESNEIYNVSDIKRKDILGDKSIKNVTFQNGIAYLACGFGIVAVNLEKREIKDTYIIGDDGAKLTVYDVAFKGQDIYAGTQQGIKRVVDSQNANLLDYHVWETMSGFPRDGQKTKNILLFNNQIVAQYATGEAVGDEFFVLEETGWRRVLNEVRYAYYIEANDLELLVASDGIGFIFDENFTRTAKVDAYQFSDYKVDNIAPHGMIKDKDDLIWIADYSQGLVKVADSEYEKVSPPGPVDNSIYSLTANGDDLWIASGGTNSYWNNSQISPQFQLKRGDEWKAWNRSNVTAFSSSVRDIVNIVVDPKDPDHIFLTSWGSGVFEFRKDDNEDFQLANWYFNDNSPLENALSHGHYTRCKGMDFDKEGNLYVSNSHGVHNLHQLSPGGDWESYEVDAAVDDQYVGDVIVSKDDNVWMLDRRDGLVVVNINDPSQYKNLSVEALFTNSDVEKVTNMNDVYSLAEDNDGAVWVGTSLGIAVYHSPRRVFEQDKFYAYQPGLDLNDGLYHPLLEKEVVTTIAVDGANRKWCGTQSSGVYLISENGEKELEHFTVDNSPLLSNQISDIAINSNTGEVYIGTASGLVSYMGDAIESKNAYSNVFVYPNPVRETYQGDIIVKGLKESTEIKITDVAGNLVYETTSLGGQAIWDGKNSHGNRVSTGVYLVMGADAGKTESFITKILFIH